MIKRINISFFRWKSRGNSRGQAPIYCRLKSDVVVKQFTTGMSIFEKDWDNIGKEPRLDILEQRE